MYVEHLRLRRSFAFCRVWGSAEEHDLHIHDCLEIGVLLKHELEYRFGDRSYRGRPGDVFLCRPFEPHWSYAEPDKPFECILVLFTPAAARSLPDGSRLLVPFYTQYGVPPVIPGDSQYAEAIRRAACEAMEAQERAAEAWVTHQYMHLINILLQVDAFARDNLKEHAGHAPRTAVADSVGMIMKHYREPLSGEQLARQAGMARSLYYEQFRALTGLSPHEFVTRLRLQNAMDLLRSTKASIIEIAEISGFQSLSAFNKQFKAYTGLSPREYRNAGAISRNDGEK